MITVNIGSEVNTMSADLDRAKELLSTGQYTCVLCRGEAIHTSTSRGVRPLLELLDSGKSYQDFSASDKVVGKATAFLYILLGIREIHAQVISKAAISALRAHNVPVQWDTLVPAISNRERTGFCPMETAVREIEDPTEALHAVRAALKALQQA